MVNNDTKIRSWSCFSIISKGLYDDNGRYISKEEDAFDPNEITKILNIKPQSIRIYGARREGVDNPDSVYCSSAWFSEKVTDPPIDRDSHCYCIVQWLIPHENELIEYKKTHNVYYEIEICIYESGNDILIDSEIISFCNRVGIEIRFNTLLTHTSL